MLIYLVREVENRRETREWVFLSRQSGSDLVDHATQGNAMAPWRYLLSAAQQKQAVHVDSTPHNIMEAFWQKLQTGSAVSIGVVGSSVAVSGGCQAERQPKLRCAGFDGKHVGKQRVFARELGGKFVMDSAFERILVNKNRPVRGFVMQTLDWINATFPHAKHRVLNAGIDAATANVIEPCMLSRHPELAEMDLILLELGSQAWYKNQVDASERIVRRLIAAGSEAPIIFVTVRQWCGKSVHGILRDEAMTLRTKYNGPEDRFAELCKAYNLTCLSMRDAIYEDVMASRPNFTVADVAGDCLHPEQSRFGYTYLADMINSFLAASLSRSRRSVATAPNTPLMQPRIRRRFLPPPVHPKNLRFSKSWRCYAIDSMMGGARTNRGQRAVGSGEREIPLNWWAEHPSGSQPDNLRCSAMRRCVSGLPMQHHNTDEMSAIKCLQGRRHWQWCSHTIAPAVPGRLPTLKPGIVSMLPGSSMRFAVDTTSPGAQQGSTAVVLNYLRSYEGMGVVNVSCESGCTCDSRLVDALHMASLGKSLGRTTHRKARGGKLGTHVREPPAVPSRNVSVTASASFNVTHSRTCVMRLANVPRNAGTTISAIAKWKLLSVHVTGPE